jgi:NAD(P)H-hydrate epimerase
MSQARPAPEEVSSLPPRRPESHKGDYGRAVLIGGSRGMAGAITLSGLGALRSGAGLVRLAVPESIQATVAGYEPSYMTAALPADEQGRLSRRARRVLEPWLADATAVAIGPGLGRSEELNSLVAWLYARLPQPLVLDADALYALAARPESLQRHAGPRVLTPHPGEFAHLLGIQTSEAIARRESLATQLAARLGIVLVVKGNRTYITNGAQDAINTTGNPGMATGGTGDVLTGVVTALLCQGLAPFPAARLAAHVHGLAGDLAAAELGQTSLIASDLPRYLPAAFELCHTSNAPKA